MELNSGQLAAMSGIMEDFNRHRGRLREAALIGYAGTGKTYTTAAVVREVCALGAGLSVLAPTHKAKDVLRRQLAEHGLSVNVKTLHKGTGSVPSENGGLEHVATADVASADFVIVDEASMLSDRMHAELLKRCSGSAYILYVGDEYQLPPVNSETMPAFEAASYTARLERVERYDESEDLAAATDALRACIRGEGPLPALTDAFASTTGGAQKAASILEDMRREGLEAAVIAYRNGTVQDACAKAQAKRFGPGPYRWRVGERFVLYAEYVGANAWESLTNGTEAQILEILDEADPDAKTGEPHTYLLRVDIDGTEQVVQMSAPGDCEARRAQLSRLRSYAQRKEALRVGFGRQTYALTAHKAQGTSLDGVVVMLDDIKRSRDKARMLYVALTRVKDEENLVFVRGV